MATHIEIANRLRELQHDDGRINPQEVVNDARDPSSPLHDSFEWDDAVAADAHRLQQARRLIRSVKIEVTVHNVPLRAPVYVRDPSNSVYRTVATIRNEEDQARAAIIAEMRKVANAIKRAKTLALILGLEDEITNIEALTDTIITRAQNSAQPEGMA